MDLNKFSFVRVMWFQQNMIDVVETKINDALWLQKMIFLDLELALNVVLIPNLLEIKLGLLLIMMVNIIITVFLPSYEAEASMHFY